MIKEEATDAEDEPGLNSIQELAQIIGVLLKLFTDISYHNKKLLLS